MRKPAILAAASLGFLSLAGGAALACDWDDGGYRQSRVRGYSYAPRAYGYYGYAPAYGYRSAYWDDDDYGYGYGGVAVGVDVGSGRRFHRRQHARTAFNSGTRDVRIREGAGRANVGREGTAVRGAASGEAGRAGGPGARVSTGGGMGGGGRDGGGRR